MENPQDDPREFHQHGGGGLETAPEGIEPFLSVSPARYSPTLATHRDPSGPTEYIGQPAESAENSRN